MENTCKIKNLDVIVNEPPLICGDFRDSSHAAEYIASTPHRILLEGYLLYAYKGDDSIKSIIITTGHSYGKMMISVIYDGYKMIHSGMTLDGLDSYVMKLRNDKKLNKIYSSLTSRFYDS